MRREPDDDPSARPATVDYAAVFAAIPTSYLVMSPVAPDYVVLDANDTYLRNVGRRREEILGVPVFEAFPPSADTLDPDGVPWIRLSFDRAVATGRPDTMPLQKYDVPDPDGTHMVERYWSLISVPILDAAGEVILLVQRAENITDFMQQRGDDHGVERGALWRRRAEEVEADLYARARELAAALAAKDAASKRLSSLAEVALQLGSADSVEDLAAVLFESAFPVLQACGGSIAVRASDSDVLQVTVIDSLGSEMQRTHAELPLDGPLPTSIVARGGGMVLVGDEEAARAYDGLTEALVMSGTRAWAVLPLQSGERLLGALSVGFPERQQFPVEQLELLRGLAAQCAQVLDRLQVREAERRAAAEVARIAETLQRSLLSEPPASPSLAFGVIYQPAQQVAQVGGDWYDAFETSSGWTSIVIGDVAGHDQDAAATMAQMRNILRGIAQTLEQPPAAILEALDRSLNRLRVGSLASMVLAQIGPPHDQDRSRTMRWCNAGHPPPLLRRADGTTQVLAAPPDVLVGITLSSARADHEIELRPGDTVLLYTDGLVETRGGDIEHDIEQLRRRVVDHAAASGPGELVRALVADLPAYDDDIALLAVQAL